MSAAFFTPAQSLTEPQAYSVKRHGRNITNCDSEPVQTPGCVQAHGALLVVRLLDLHILQVSDNALAVLGHAPEELLGRACSLVIGLDGQEKLRVLLDTAPAERNPLYLLTLPVARAGTKEANALDVTVHTVDGVAILEFESTGRTDEVNPDYYALIKKTVTRLQTAGSLREFCDSVCQEIHELTGLDRVMVYKFHADGHGEVFAESHGPDLGSWLGLHYPAEDIPKPARDVFTKTWLRPIPDMSGGLAELVPLVNPDTGKPLEMTSCALRGVSLMCTEYFRNMGVAATLTMSIRRNESLWGLISCHHYTGPKHFTYQVRAACEFLAQVVSLQHHAAEDKEHQAYRQQLADVHRQLVTAAAEGGGLAALTAGTPSLLQGIEAGGAALFHLDRWWCVGNTPSEEQLEGLGEWLIDGEFASSLRPLYATDCLVRDYPPAAAFSALASGLLATPIALSGRNLMLWFRPETLQTVNWGGNPHDKPTVLGPNGPRLTPRRSFELFVESVHQRSLPWLQVEIEAAAGIRLLVMEMVVDRAERLATLNADLARSNEELEAFAYVASHDLKEPLRGITQYAHQLMDDAALVSDGNRGKLDRLMQLTQRMDGLLDSLLHFSRVGRADLTLETVDLDEVVSEALEMVGSTGANLEVVRPRPLPVLRCHRVWCREVFVSLLSNAIKFSDKASKRVEIGFVEPGDNHPRPGCPAESAGQTIFYVADNGIGIEPKHFNQVFKLFKRLHGRHEYGAGSGAGLTIVRKLVERHGGRVWLDSEPGRGTTAYFTLPNKDAL